MTTGRHLKQRTIKSRKGCLIFRNTSAPNVAVHYMKTKNHERVRAFSILNNRRGFHIHNSGEIPIISEKPGASRARVSSNPSNCSKSILKTIYLSSLVKGIRNQTRAIPVGFSPGKHRGDSPRFPLKPGRGLNDYCRT